MTYTFYPNQIETAQKLLDASDNYRYSIVKAPMQSGKTGLYLYYSLMMLKLEKVENVIIICGTTDKKLREQLQNDVTLSQKSFERQAARDGVSDEVLDRLSNISVKFSQDLNKDLHQETLSKTLIIFDESHYAQTRDQRPDMWLKRKGLPNACAGNNALLEELNIFFTSVSATPFSEIINERHQQSTDAANPQKITIEMIPPPGYRGTDYYTSNGCVRPTFNLKTSDGKAHFKKMIRDIPSNKYSIMRFQGKDRGRVEEILKDLTNVDVKTYDQSDEENIDEKFLKIVPTKPTIILIKGKLRMGERMWKENISVVYEGAKDTNTDTAFQGLFGRSCGIPSTDNPFPVQDITIYVPEKVITDIGNYSDPDFTPTNGGMNVSKSTTRIVKSGLHPIVPIKISEWTKGKIFTDAQEVLPYLFKTWKYPLGPWSNLSVEQYDELKGIDKIQKSNINCKTYQKINLYEKIVHHHSENIPLSIDNKILNVIFNGKKEENTHDPTKGTENQFIWLTASTKGQGLKTFIKIPITSGKEIYTHQSKPGTKCDDLKKAQEIILKPECCDDVKMFEKDLTDAIIRSQSGASKLISSVIGNNKCKGIALCNELYSIEEVKKNNSVMISSSTKSFKSVLDTILPVLEKQYNIKFNKISLKGGRIPKGFDNIKYLRVEHISWE